MSEQLLCVGGECNGQIVQARNGLREDERWEVQVNAPSAAAAASIYSSAQEISNRAVYCLTIWHTRGTEIRYLRPNGTAPEDSMRWLIKKAMSK